MFTHVSDSFESVRLKDLVRSEKDGGIMPDIDKSVGEFEALIRWTEVN